MLLEFSKLVAFSSACSLSTLSSAPSSSPSKTRTPSSSPPRSSPTASSTASSLSPLSAVISLLGGVIFRESEPRSHPSLVATLPLRMFSWATSIMLVLFVLARFLETHYIFTPKVHW